MEKADLFLFKSISYNMLLQVSFRVFSFVLNAILLRYVSTELIGACNFRLALLVTTVLFLSREPFRRALPSLKSVETSWQVFLNTIWLVVPNGMILCALFGYIWSFVFEAPNNTLVPYYKSSVFLCCIACVLELCGEIPFSLAQMYFLARQKVAIEAGSLFAFHITFVSLAIFIPSLGALSYAIARVVYSLFFIFLGFYYLLRDYKSLNSECKIKLSILELLPLRPLTSFDQNYLELVKVYYLQSFYKQLLTEGERYMITVFNLLSFGESGIYDIINNLGSLIARFVFLPIEDASYVYFTNRLLRGVTYKEQWETIKSKNETTAKTTFENLLKIVSLIGLLVFCFGQSYSQLLLQIYGGDKLGMNSLCFNMLRLYCVYVMLLAVNGVTESLFSATMSDKQLQSHNNRLVFFSAAFLICAYCFAKLFHIYGFLLANCINMIIRIYFSLTHIKWLFKGFSVEREEFIVEEHVYNVYKSYIPHMAVAISLAISLVLTSLSQNVFNFSILVHLFLGAVAFLMTSGVIYLKEEKLRHFALKFVKSKN